MSAIPQPAAARALLAVNNIEVIYDHVILVLKGVSLEVHEGRIVALLGANGAGKSTTLGAIIGLVRAQRGHVLYQGGEITNHATHSIVKRRMALAGMLLTTKSTSDGPFDE